MEIISKRNYCIRLSPRTREIITDIVVYILIMLFIYTVASKVQYFKAFQFILKQSPLFGKYHIFLSWLVLSSQVFVSVLLMVTFSRYQGLVLSLLLLLGFTCYLIYMVNSGKVPMCTCGGVIDRLTWTQHIWFNIGFIMINIMGLLCYQKTKESL